MMIPMIIMLINLMIKIMTLFMLLYLRAADLGLVHLPRLPRTDTTWLSRKLMIVVIMFIMLVIEEVKEKDREHTQCG